MLQKWHYTAMLLLTKEDLYTPVVLVKNIDDTDNEETKAEKEKKWKNAVNEHFKDVMDKFELTTVFIKAAKGECCDMYRDDFYNLGFIDYYWQQILEADGVRIKIKNITVLKVLLF